VSDDAFERVFDALPKAAYMSDRETRRFVRVNRAAAVLYGWSQEEFLTLTLRDIRPPDDMTRFEHAFARMHDQSGPFTLFARHWTKSGQAIEVELEISRVVFGGRLVSLVVATDVTGVREIERRVRLHAEHSREGIAVTAADGRVAYMSPGGERLLGVSPGEMVGELATHRIHPDDLASMPPLGPGETVTVVHRSRRNDGTWQWIEGTTTNLTHDPAVRGWVSNFRDVGKRVDTERTLVETRRRFEYLLSATAAVTYSARADVNFGATFISTNVRDVLGWEPSRYTDEDGFWLSNIHPEDRARVEAGLGELFAHGAHSFEYRSRHADGRYRWMHDESRLVRDDAGKPNEIVGYMVDITERKRAEESLARSEANFRVLAERSPTIMMVHRDGNIVYMNPAGIAMLGYRSLEEVVGMPIIDLVHPDDRASVTTRMAHTAKHGGGAPGEARMRRRDGTYVIADGEGFVLDFDGLPSHVVVGSDVTERRELFARMALADRLVSVGTLAAGVAHEINNPLAYVSSNLELLGRELPRLLAGEASHLSREEIAELLKDAREGAARVGAIVRELRALSRSDDAPGAVDIAAVLASCIKIAHNEIRHRARIVSDVEDKLPPATGTASRLGQVFLNLLVNAAHAIREGHAEANEIRVRAYSVPATREVAVEIEDTGAGIPPNVLGRIFDPFFTTKPVGVGTGLGLSISHEIVRSYGGSITVDSTPGAGSTFRVVLPVAVAQPALVSDAPAADAAVTARVLVIDDEHAVGRSIALLLSPEYDVTCVTRAKEALAKLTAGERFDAIVCDLMMPEMTGIDFYQHLAPE
jgi:PAS domain S-box-containing protein